MTDHATTARDGRALDNPDHDASTRCGTGTHRRLHRVLTLAVTIAALAGAAFAIPLDAVPRLTNALGPAAPAAVVAAGAVLLSVLVPRTAITLACGALFGALAGAVCALAAALLAAVATYAAGRWAGRGGRLGSGRLARRLAGRLRRLDIWLARRGLLAVVVVRMLPLAPYGLIGYAYGTSSVRSRHYLVGTAIGAAPSCFSYAAIGAATVSPGSLDWITFLPAMLGMLISVAAAWHWRRTHRRSCVTPPR